MKKHFILYSFLCTLALTSQAQLGLPSVGVLSAFGNSFLGEGNLLGKSHIAASVTCRQQCNVLAVTGLQLEAKRLTKNEVTLNWYTLTETNNKGFFMQRSLGSNNHFQTTAFVNGRGNSSGQSRYGFIDTNSFSGVSYYKIQQENNDGSVAYSNVVSVTGIDDNRFVMYPNPSSGKVVLLLPSNYSASVATVTFYDAAGRKVFKNTYAVGAGSEIQLTNLAGLQTGTYQVSVSSDNLKTLQGKMIIAK